MPNAKIGNSSNGQYILILRFVRKQMHTSRKLTDYAYKKYLLTNLHKV